MIQKTGVSMSQAAILRMSEQAVLNIVKFVKVAIKFEISNTEIRSIKYVKF